MSLKEKLQIYRIEGFPSWILAEPIAFLEFTYLYWVFDTKGDLDGDLVAGSLDEKTLAPSIACLIRCFRSDDMRYSWEKIQSIFPGSIKKSQLWFATALYYSFVSYALYYSFVSYERNDVTKGEAKDWRLKLRGSLKESQRLINETPGNIRGLMCYMGKEEVGYGRNPDFFIQELIDALDRTKYIQGYYGGSVHGQYADRKYFIRSLTAAFIQMTGRPYRKVVAYSASAAFNCSLSESEIIRATKGLDLAPTHSAYEDDESMELGLRNLGNLIERREWLEY